MADLPPGFEGLTIIDQPDTDPNDPDWKAMASAWRRRTLGQKIDRARAGLQEVSHENHPAPDEDLGRTDLGEIRP